MYSRRSHLFVVALLVVLAGCVGGGGDMPSVEDADSAGGSAGADDGATGDATSGSDAFALSDPESLLRDAGSFTVTWSYSGVDASGAKIDVTREFYADLEAERSHTRTTSATNGQTDGGNVEQFVDGSVTYVRFGTGDDAFVSSQEGSSEVLGTAIALSQARAYGADDDLVSAGTETFDGISVDRYELSATDEALIRAGSVSGQGGPGDFEVTNFEYAVLVDENGLSRHESWQFSGRADEQAVRGAWEFSLTGVGSTMVEEPDWVAQAEA